MLCSVRNMKLNLSPQLVFKHFKNFYTRFKAKCEWDEWEKSLKDGYGYYLEVW